MTADMLAEVVRSVAARHPVNGREARSRHRTLVALDRLADPFDREADPTHLTGSALIVGPRGVVLHRHKRLGLWLQPGGHLDPGEDPWTAARREGEEETGLRLVWPGEGVPPLVHLDVHDGGRGHTHLDLRYVLHVAGDDTPRPPDGESQDVAWFDWQDAYAMADPGLIGLLIQVGPPHR